MLNVFLRAVRQAAGCAMVIVLLAASVIRAGDYSFPAPGHEGLNTTHVGDLGELKLNLWLQYRIMYNRSNIPGPGGTSFSDTKSYDFFRQRFRAAIDIYAPAEKIGGYAQIESRGGWGGSSPTVSDPRNLRPVNNPFNRMQSRGLRYAFLYAHLKDEVNLSAGILPLTDQVGRLLFDADWDFNVGGIVLNGDICNGTYRFGFARLVEGVGGTNAQIGDDADLFILDYSREIFSFLEAGAHIYDFQAPVSLGVISSTKERWYGVTLKGEVSGIDVNGLVMVNDGEVGGISHTGLAEKIEGSAAFGGIKTSLLLINTSGDEQGRVDNRFVTVHQLVGTSGYWGYTHIFNAGVPSDVNDLGIEAGNGGAGLMTLQGKVDFPILDKLSGQVFGGWFAAGKKRNNTHDIGIETGGMLTYEIASHLSWEIGAAGASLGDFYAVNADNLSEIFSRLQFAW